LFFGEHLMPVLHAIKTAFDPDNMFNPGKLAVSEGSPYTVEKIDEVPFRGVFDQAIDPAWARQYDSAINCNGNAACFSWQVNDAMCPSYKATRDKTLSPKGRAAMLREWARLQSTSPNSVLIPALEGELYRSLNACLSCKSCSYSCPLKVDIPDLKSSFLQHYHQQHRRKLRDTIFANLEAAGSIATMAPQLANILIQNPLSKMILKTVFGIVSTPRYSESLQKGLAQRNTAFLELNNLPGNPPTSDNQVILIADSFNANYSAEVLLSAYDILQKFGCEVMVAPIMRNGKALHVKGFRDQFKRLAREQVEQFERLAATGRPLLSIEVVTRLMHEKEYAELVEKTPDYQIWSIEHWLSTLITEAKLELREQHHDGADREYLLLPHCMEQTADRQSAQDWNTIFEYLGHSLTVKAAGCCGMSGLFGHERENQNLSDDIFRLNWQGIASDNSAGILASGFSCRCQLQRHGFPVEHPLSVLNQMI
jgi:Fe-S oxidoreductase